jgi:acetyl-CoA acyltransferase 1
VKYTDPKTGNESSVTVNKDDGVRPGTTIEVLSKLKPAFAKDGTTHAGNASQVSDGAAAVILARRSVAEKHGLPIQGKFVAASVIGVPPAIMGVGPAYAIPKLLGKAGLTIDDIDIFEINEAFASQCLYSAQVLSIHAYTNNLVIENSYGEIESKRGCNCFRTSFGCIWR